MKTISTYIRTTITTLLSAGVLLVPVLAPATVSAQSNVLDPACSQGAQSSPVCVDSKKTSNPLFGPTGVITKAAKLIALIVGIASVFMVMIGGLRYVFSHGDSNAINAARSTIIYALAGLIVALSAQAIISFVLVKL